MIFMTCTNLRCKITQFLSYKHQNHQKIIQYSDNLTIIHTIPYPFNLASVLLRFLVVVDAHEEDVSSVFGNLCGILLALNLVDGSVGRVVEFQFDNEGGFADVATRNHHQVGTPGQGTNLSPMIPEITSNPPNRPIWFVDDPIWFADTSFCISNTQQLLKIASNSALFFQKPCTIQINVLPLQHQNPQAS